MDRPVAGIAVAMRRLWAAQPGAQAMTMAGIESMAVCSPAAMRRHGAVARPCAALKRRPLGMRSTGADGTRHAP